MIIKDVEIHERKISAVVTQAEIFAAVKLLVCERAGLHPDAPTSSRVYISNRNSGGIGSAEYEANVEITVSSEPPPEAA